MPYRRTANVVRKQAARHETILRAAREVADSGGMAALQIGAVAERAGIAAGTVYRYFPSKTELVGALITELSRSELIAIQRAADAAPGPLSALSAAITTFVARALRRRRLLWALMAEPVDAAVEPLRVSFRNDLAIELRGRILAAVTRQLLPEQEPDLSAPALVGALLEGAIGPIAPQPRDDMVARREQVQALTLFALRALGVLDARARGLVVQTAMPPEES